MKQEELTIRISTNYVKRLNTLFGNIEITSPCTLPFAGKYGTDGKKAEIVFKKIKQFAIKEIKKLKEL